MKRRKQTKADESRRKRLGHLDTMNFRNLPTCGTDDDECLLELCDRERLNQNGQLRFLRFRLDYCSCLSTLFLRPTRPSNLSRKVPIREHPF